MPTLQEPDYRPQAVKDQEESFNSGYAQAGTDQAEAFANDPKNASDVQEKEGAMPYEQSSSSDHNVQGGRTKAFVKKGAPAGGIIGAIVGGLFGVGVLFSPSLAVVHMKELFTEDLNDSVAAMDIRSFHFFRAKLKNLGTGVCTGVKIRCGLRGMTDRQIRAFEKAGIEVEKGPQNRFSPRKTSIKSLTFTGSDGTKIPISNPTQLNEYLGDGAIRKQIRRAYNPLFYSTWDKTFGKVLTKFKTSKADKLKGKSKAELDESMKAAVDGDQTSLDGKASSVDCTGKTAEECEQARQQAQTEADSKSGPVESKPGGVKSVFKNLGGGALKGVGIVGTADSACVVYNTSRAVETGAKIVRAAQLVRFAMVFFTFADTVKAGTATKEKAEYTGDKLATVDPNEFVVNETSSDAGDKVKNPYYGKNAFDSEGAHAAYYNDAPKLTAQAQQFLIGGGLVGTLAGINNKITEAIPGDPKDSCGIIQNPFVRGGSLIIGIAAGIGSFGLWTAASVGASIAIAAAIPILESYLQNMLAGEVVGPDTVGVDAGNAIFAGTGAMLGESAKQRGMKPATEPELQNYLAQQNTIKQEYIAMGIEDTKNTPFDVMNQYSFMGIVARNLLPVYTRSSSPISAAMMNTPNILPLALASLSPQVGAVGDYNPDRFKQCRDTGYDKVGIDADIFCNVRYVMSDTELNMDTEDNYAWMESNGYIDSDHNVLDKGSKDYKEFQEDCIDRQAGWGDQAGEGGDAIGTDGKWCLGDSAKLSHFRVYTMDRSIEVGMDEGPVSDAANASNPTSAPTGDVAWPVDEQWWESNRSDFLDAHTMATGTFTNPYIRGIAVDISTPPLGSPIYSMLDGVVERVNLCGANDGMVVKSEVPGGTLHIAYGHGTNPRFQVGDTVSSGQQILSLGDVGCHISGPHLHMDIALNTTHICPQDVFLAMDTAGSVDWTSLTSRAAAPCGRL